MKQILGHSFQFAAQNESPKMELANQGWIQGKLLKTVGNLDNEPRTIYTYRNIPYADHSQFLRFQVEKRGKEND